MPRPAMPCLGRFTEEVQHLLRRNASREQWLTFPCETCGTIVGAKQVQGAKQIQGNVQAGIEWLPEAHWPSVHYVSREKRAKK